MATPRLNEAYHYMIPLKSSSLSISSNTIQRAVKTLLFCTLSDAHCIVHEKQVHCSLSNELATTENHTG